jgi:hypothetical protein
VIAIGMSVGNVFRRAWWPHQAILGKVDDLAGPMIWRVTPEGEVLPKCTILRFDAPLILPTHAPSEIGFGLGRRARPGGWVIVAAEPITDVDTTACDMLDDLAATFGGPGHAVGVR